ncbi:hypoxanthine phosphoribosyltransferase [Paucilactobacillus suebicus]|uniref:Hypoxanthine phosphoribosyltransferase n=1 Tax=Paucilactobacillus suebicus DSM 5007 = KCTC 3549 TaxID=1423807 RepID=A0A0R1W0U2_9LACO|nr:hypoxanthine phosphoribosyltransferase [Paucilactobacillus suebicus]KRM09739.1 hypoxanthine-guanine phosphoribosyltransferase [Paucilactobacillus suebicus DSM 5007 = KCTC 3549]
MNNDIERVLYSEEDIRAVVTKLGKQLTNDYQGKKPLVISVLKGACLFTVDIIKRMDVYLDLDFINISSYHGGTESSGKIDLLSDLKEDVADRDVLIIEDIIDTGRSLEYLVNLFKKRDAHDVKVCSLLDKPEGRVVDVNVDYVGFHVPNEFVVGYGLDYEELYRNLPYVGVLKPTVYEK